MISYWWVAVAVLALYGLVVATLDVIERVLSRDALRTDSLPVSVLVIAKNREDSIEAFLRSLVRIGISGSVIPHEIVVVDEYSSDSTWSVVQRLAASFPAIRAMRMSDVSVAAGHAGVLELCALAGGVGLVCRLDGMVDDSVLLSVIRQMLKKQAPESAPPASTPA